MRPDEILTSDQALRRLASGEALTVAVDPRLRYQPTGLGVRPGEQYVLAASGKWRDGFKICGPAGWGSGWLTRFNRLPRQPFFYLCGCLGRDDRQAFPIGVTREWSVPAAIPGPDDSRLYLFANDWPMMYWNNKALDETEGGPLSVTITRVP